MASRGASGTQCGRTKLVTVLPSGVHVCEPRNPRDAGEAQLLRQGDLEVLKIMVAKNQSKTRHVRTQPFWPRPWLIPIILALLVSAHLVTAPEGHAQDGLPEYQ